MGDQQLSREIYTLNPELFTWQRWRAGSPETFTLKCRENILVMNRHKLRKHTVGYCDATRTVCRPKVGHKAVMFYHNGIHFWFHLREKEFKLIYAERI